MRSDQSDQKINQSSLSRIGPIHTINKWFSLHTRDSELKGRLGLEQVSTLNSYEARKYKFQGDSWF